jgi:hypothetical protein
MNRRKAITLLGGAAAAAWPFVHARSSLSACGALVCSWGFRTPSGVSIVVRN